MARDKHPTSDLICVWVNPDDPETPREGMIFLLPKTVVLQNSAKGFEVCPEKEAMEFAMNGGKDDLLFAFAMALQTHEQEALKAARAGNAPLADLALARAAHAFGLGESLYLVPGATCSAAQAAKPVSSKKPAVKKASAPPPDKTKGRARK